MMKSLLRPLLMLFTALLFVFATGLSAAQAASPHFKKNGEPVCTVSVSGSTATTTCKTVLAGLGNEDLLATVTVSGFAVYECQNYGGNVAPGQNKVVTGPVTAPTFIDSSAIKNGNLSLTTNPAVLTAKPTATAEEAGCPNDNWTGVNPKLTVTSITLVIYQPAPTETSPGVKIYECTYTDPNGITGSVTLTCPL
ncbi:hypothetical protein [Arthrobacter sp. C152]